MGDWRVRWWKVLVCIGALWLIFAVRECSKPDKDSTDPPDGRSGFILMIDHGTGCQYLRAPWFGDFRPRLDKDGRHVCTQVHKGNE